jgi:preprotein translocase subunit SecE
MAMNRQTKRAMAKQGADKPSRPERKSAAERTATERTGPRQYLTEVRGEMKKVAWPPKPEIINSSVVVLIGLVVMTALVFGFDWVSVHIVDFIFK